VGTHAIIPN